MRWLLLTVLFAAFVGPARAQEPTPVPPPVKPDVPHVFIFEAGKAQGDLSRYFAPPSQTNVPIPRSGPFGAVDLADDLFAVRTEAQFVSGDPGGYRSATALNAHISSFKGVRFGFGARHSFIHEQQDLFSSRFTAFDIANRRHFLVAGIQLGLGRYNRTHVRVGYFTGGAWTSFTANVYAHGQLINNDSTNNLGWTVQRLDLVEIQARYFRNLGKHSFVLDGTVRRYRVFATDSYSNDAHLLPDHPLMLQASATYISPLRLGAFTRISHTGERGGPALLGDQLTFGGLVKF